MPATETARAAQARNTRTAPRITAIGKPDVVRFLTTLAELSGEMLGMNIEVTGVRRRKAGDGGRLFVLESGANEGKTRQESA